jgi:hypothetical protein
MYLFWSLMHVLQTAWTRGVEPAPASSAEAAPAVRAA